jgi:hypothetical protein
LWALRSLATAIEALGAVLARLCGVETLVSPEALTMPSVAFAAPLVALGFFSAPGAFAAAGLAGFPPVSRRTLVARPTIETGRRAIAASCLPGVSSAFTPWSACGELVARWSRRAKLPPGLAAQHVGVARRGTAIGASSLFAACGVVRRGRRVRGDPFDEDAAPFSVCDPAATHMAAFIRICRLSSTEGSMRPFRRSLLHATFSFASRRPTLRVAPAMAMGRASPTLRNRLRIAQAARLIGVTPFLGWTA